MTYVVPKRNNNKESKYSGFCAVYATAMRMKNEWYLDSGASLHMTMREDWFKIKKIRKLWQII